MRALAIWEGSAVIWEIYGVLVEGFRVQGLGCRDEIGVTFRCTKGSTIRIISSSFTRLFWSHKLKM